MDIPITFTYAGRTYHGIFSRVSGAGSTTTFHLLIKRFYEGQLFYTNAGWKFFSQNGKFQELSDFFGDYITAWVG